MDYQKIFNDVLLLEARSLERAIGRNSPEAINKVAALLAGMNDRNGNLFFSGVGKSGLVARKLASTFSSLGLSSHFLHPTEALHGDLGRVTSSDAIVFISKSGHTEEILRLMPFLKLEANAIIGLLGNVDSPIASRCGIVFDCSVEREACVNNQAPTASTTLTFAIGDAIAVVYQNATGLSREGFAVNHPGGVLGKALRLKVRDLMTPSQDCPRVSRDATLEDVILEMTRFPVGACAVIENDKAIGFVVEADIRRTFARKLKGLATPVKDIMNSTPITIEADAVAAEAMELMENRDRPFYVIPVIENGSFVGILRTHDLLQHGLFLRKKDSIPSR
jgi:arabinose-5-phosphate isomerase